jgi:hypothetical protein
MHRALNHSIFRRPRGHRSAIRCAIAIILVTAWSGMPVAVLAQSGPLPQMNAPGPWPAPTGHRQPRPQDLPPDVLRDEGMKPQGQSPAPTTQPPGPRDQGNQRASRGPFGGGDLRICRQC